MRSAYQAIFTPNGHLERKLTKNEIRYHNEQIRLFYENAKQNEFKKIQKDYLKNPQKDMKKYQQLLSEVNFETAW